VEALTDDGALEQALTAAGVDTRGMPVVLFGRSMGSSVAVHLAAHSPSRFRGLIVESGFASMSARLDAYSGGSGGGGEMKAVEDALPKPLGGVEKVGLMENEDKLAELVHMPTLILHGSSDRIVHPMQAQLAYAASGASESGPGARKTLVMIEGAGHNDIAMSEQYFGSIARFMDEALAKH
jgi:pimeloyl-ACP methyl ester carboxylesterase